MSWSLGIPTAPSPALVSTADMKAHLRLVGTADDDYIDALIEAATYFIQAYTGRLIYSQIVSEYQDAFPTCPEMHLHVYPITGAVVNYFEPDAVDPDVYAVLADTEYWTNNRKVPATIETKSSWPATENRAMAVQVQVTGGDTTPRPDIIHALKIIVGHWYEFPDETSVSIPAPARALLLQHRFFR